MSRMKALAEDALAAANELCEAAIRHGLRCDDCPLWVEAGTVDPRYDHYGETQDEKTDYCVIDWLSERAEEKR